MSQITVNCSVSDSVGRGGSEAPGALSRSRPSSLPSPSPVSPPSPKPNGFALFQAGIKSLT